jgi:transcriptional regulator with XRE-family HTH domain
MTPFGRRLRELRTRKGTTLKDMAEAIGVSPAYLSALEHGHRGMPTYYLLQRIITYFNIIWDEAEDLERLAQNSDPRVVVDTSGLSPTATAFANRLARSVGDLTDADLEALLALLDARLKAQPRR